MTSPEHDMMRDGARRALDGELPRSMLMEAGSDGSGAMAAAWELAARMGWTGLMVAEGAGGLGMGLADAVVIGEEMGRAVFPAPFGVSCVLAPVLLSAAGPSPGRDGILRAIAAGDISLAIVEGGVRLSGSPPDARFDGQADVVAYGDAASHLLILGPPDAGRTTFGVIAGRAEGVAIDSRPALDPGCPLARVTLAGTIPQEAAIYVVPEPVLERARRAERIFASAELAGVAQAALDAAVAYAGERRQFGVPIGSFQALKHRLSDDFVLIQNARAATAQAAKDYDRGSAESAIAADVAWTCAVDAALRATGTCVQIHGALGFSWEHESHLFLKRARRLVAGHDGAGPALARIGRHLETAFAEGSDPFARSGARPETETLNH